MIHVSTHRFGPIVVAVNTNDNHEHRVTLGLTAEGATRRLIRKIDREYR